MWPARCCMCYPRCRVQIRWLNWTYKTMFVSGGLGEVCGGWCERLWWVLSISLELNGSLGIRGWKKADGEPLNLWSIVGTVGHSTKRPVTTMLTYPWKCTVLHCNHLGSTWKPLVLMTRHFDYCPSASEGDNQSVRSSAPVFPRWLQCKTVHFQG